MHNWLNSTKKDTEGNPWSWILSLYFIQGLPYILVNSVSIVLLKNLDVSNAQIGLFSFLNLPWMIKPLWSPFVDKVKTKRWWMLFAQYFIAVLLAGISLTLQLGNFLIPMLVVFTLMAFASATNDIATDGYYMLALNPSQQSFFVGIRSTAYRFAMIAGTGGVTYLAGSLEKSLGPRVSWSIAFVAVAIVFALITVYHQWSLPKVENTANEENTSQLSATKDAFVSYFKKKNIWVALLFIVLYRLGESQLARMAPPFILDSAEKGGLGITTSQFALIYGTAGVSALVFGGILGGILASRIGLKKLIFPMALAMNIPNLLYVYLAYTLPENQWFVTSVVVIEQFGYGFGFTGFMLYLLYFSQGQHETTHYALSTGFMTLGVLLSGAVSGYIEEAVGYLDFFKVVCFSAIPGLILIPFLGLKENFGVKEKV